METTSARWRGWWPTDNIVAKFASPCVAVTRDSNHLDLFVAGSDNMTYTAGWAAAISNQAWRGWWNIHTESIQPGGNLTAVSRAPNKLDAFHVGNNGGVYTATWESGVNNNTRTGWWRIGSLQAKPGSVVTAVSRDSNKLDVFVTGNDGKVYTAAWDANVPGGWRGWWDILGGLVPAGGAVTAVAGTSKKLDVFVVSGDGFVYTAAWEGGVNDNAWAGWWQIGSLKAKPGSVVTAVSRDPNKLDLFVAGSDGKIYRRVGSERAGRLARLVDDSHGRNPAWRRHYRSLPRAEQAGCIPCRQRRRSLHRGMGGRREQRPLGRMVAYWHP